MSESPLCSHVQDVGAHGMFVSFCPKVGVFNHEGGMYCESHYHSLTWNEMVGRFHRKTKWQFYHSKKTGYAQDGYAFSG
jgi:hypothetical protein